MKQQIREFMSSTGVLPEVESMTKYRYRELQLDLVEKLLEEVLELKEALENCDFENSVKELIDVKYVADQIEITAEIAGVNIVECCDEVCLNNQLKYTTNKDLAYSWLEGTYNRYVDENVAEDGVTYYCVKDLDTHKVKKYNNFPSPDLKQHIPEYLY